MQPLISVIVPNRVGEKNESLPSIKKQTYKNLEIIEVVDQDKKGASWTRNHGRKKATGEFIFFCDNDVTLEPDCIENLYNTLRANPHADWAFGRFIFGGVEFNRKKGPLTATIGTKEFVDYFHGVSTMSLIRAEADPVFDEEMLRYDDWELWVRLTKEGHTPAYCDKLLFTTELRPGGLTTGQESKEWMNKLYEKHVHQKIADIIIPHHDQHDLLAKCLARIPNKIFNIIVTSGGTFAENCNRAAKIAKTDTMIFLNDDTEPDEHSLRMLATIKEDIAGVAQFIPLHHCTFYGIGLHMREQPEPFLARTFEETAMPSGFCFKVSKKAWEKLNGLDERYRNGAEDTDFFLRAAEAGYQFGYASAVIPHLLSKSTGRFLYNRDNTRLWQERWNRERIKKALINIKKSISNYMKVQITSPVYYQGVLRERGSIVEVEPDKAQALIEKKCAIAVNEPPKENKEQKPEPSPKAKTKKTRIVTSRTKKVVTK